VRTTLGESVLARAGHHDAAPDRAVLITGGAGFVGSNLAAALLSARRRVIILDNISRSGVRRNVAWLRDRFGDAFELRIADVRDRETVHAAVSDVATVFHLAAQVAVTTSLADPLEDFAVNTVGTLNVLEAIRSQPCPPMLVYTSSNKVYGALDDIPLDPTPTRYVPSEPAVAAAGIGEDRQLDFCSPYGCSKGAADQYVRDYARSYGLRTTVLRMSCVYGQRQHGTEDQGWLAHFFARSLAGEPLVLYGSGRQVRDALHIDDLIEALLLCERRADAVAGKAYNIGGGPGNTTSLLELLTRIETIAGVAPVVTRADRRSGDQRYFVADTTRYTQATGWRPRTGLDAGLERLHKWISELRGTHGNRAEWRPSSKRPAHALTGDILVGRGA
jgi:CDP-paratose 2-epimerase